MDTPDRPDRALPSPPSATLPAVPHRVTWEEGAEAEAPPPPKLLTLKVVLRAVGRHWWQILGLWVLGSVIAVPLIYKYVKPTYESFALLKIESGSRSIIAQAYDPSSNTNYLDTQVQLISNPDVLGAALLDPKLAGIPRYLTSLDNEAELRKNLKVNIVPKTSLIQIAVASESPTESSTVVNAVLAAYLQKSTGWTDEETRVEINRLTEMKNEYRRIVDDLRRKLTELVNKPAVPVNQEVDKDKVSVEEYHRRKLLIDQVVMDRMLAEKVLVHLEHTMARNGHDAPLTGPALDQAVKAKFYNDPRALRLASEIKTAETNLDKVKRFSNPDRWVHEPTVKRAQKELDAKHEEWQRLWDDLEPEIREQLAASGENKVNVELERTRNRVFELKEQEKMLGENLKALKIASKAENEGSAVEQEIEFSRIDLSSAQKMFDVVETNLRQIEYEARRATRTTTIVKAKPSFRPASDSRFKMMTGGPVAWLAFLVALFVLLEVRSGRVGDPDDLPSRVKVGVIGVVPPLPTLRPARGLRGAKSERRRVEEFVQSLDHLRVTLCASQPGLGGRRCVMITSAMGGEGKTTLAAQLAGRCANAGLLTLLIDADLRRPSLGELLEVPEGPGLADVLADEATPEEAMVVIGSAGGFHLLPAGSPAGDPSRLLQGERLGALIARFRETFDVVIVDAPPVLAVPDALILGRWVDGAVLAVRHDISRFPLVERANRRLAAIGIQVLGAVVNGVRPMEATYGGYSYSTVGADEDPPTA